jgi:transposase
MVSSRKEINMPKKKVTNLDDFNKDVVRRTVLDFYDRRISISKKYIYIFALKHKMGYQGSSSSTLRILKRLGFRYKKKLMMDVNS